MGNIKIQLLQKSYGIRIGPGLINQSAGFLKELGFREKAIIITNPVVKSLYGNKLQDHLEKSGFTTAILEVPEGEEYKSLDQAGRLYGLLNESQAERLTPVLALGGGVIGDLAGFVAATYMRGIPLIQLPTTLLAQVDSSIGGKVAVNHGKLKNNIGTFYQPDLVIADTGVLKTLPEKEVFNGLAEVIKYGIIQDKMLFELIEENIEKIKSLDENWLETVVTRCAGIKAGIVEKDEKDLNLRNILNFGHTIGHAVETVSDFHIQHGEGVAVGMVAAGMIAQKMGILNLSELKRIRALIISSGLPDKIPSRDVGSLMQAMKHDKKKAGGRIRFVLPRTIGEVYLSDEVSLELVEQVLQELI